MKTVPIRLTVTAPDDASDNDVLTVVRTIIAVGEADAVESSENDEIESPGADLATCVQIKAELLRPTF